MCGRTACNQCKEVYQKACSYYDEKSCQYIQPEWKHLSNNGMEFTPSCNIAPTQVTPVLLSSAFLNDVTTNRVMAPMMWGVIPPWHKGTPNSHGLSTNNCRIENLGSSKLYDPLFKEGKRCVVICDGFYEWQTTLKSKTKQPYFIYSTQKKKETLVEDKICWLESDWNTLSGWNGPKPLYFAGLFNIWLTPEGNEIYSYSIITKESNEHFSWLHHRVPAVLSSSLDIEKWIDFKSYNIYEAMKVIEIPHEENLMSWHPVSTAVNKSTNKSSECNKRIQIKKSTLLTSWLKKEPLKREPDDDSQPGTTESFKKIKKENHASSE